MSIHRIVIVEDNPADVLLVKEALKQQDVAFTLEHFVNGEDAARVIAAMLDAPAVFVIDLNVPRVHGLELLRLIRSCPAVAGTPVTILTSSQTSEDKRVSEQLGADAFITKPLGYHDFMTQVGLGILRLLRADVDEAPRSRVASDPRPCGGCRCRLRRRVGAAGRLGMVPAAGRRFANALAVVSRR